MSMIIYCSNSVVPFSLIIKWDTVEVEMNSWFVKGRVRFLVENIFHSNLRYPPYNANINNSKIKFGRKILILIDCNYIIEW